MFKVTYFLVREIREFPFLLHILDNPLVSNRPFIVKFKFKINSSMDIASKFESHDVGI